MDTDTTPTDEQRDAINADLRQTDAEALADFEAALELFRYGVVSGREW